MAEFTRVSGGAAPYEAIGRKLEWVKVTGIDCTGYEVNGLLVPESNLEKVRRALDTVCSITIGGEPNATDVMFGCEGIGEAGVDAAAWSLALQTKIDAATAGTSTVAFVSIVGDTFA